MTATLRTELRAQTELCGGAWSSLSSCQSDTLIPSSILQHLLSLFTECSLQVAFFLCSNQTHEQLCLIEKHSSCDLDLTIGLSDNLFCDFLE